MFKLGQTDVEFELRPSPKWVALLLVLGAFTLLYLDFVWFESSDRYKMQLFELLLYVLAAAIIFLDYWRPVFSPYFSIAAVVVAIMLGLVWLSMPEFLILMTLPVIFAVILKGLSTATVTAIAEMVLVLLLPALVLPGLTSMTIIVTIIAILVTLGAMAVIYLPVYQKNAWLEQYHQEVRHELAEAQENKVEMSQLLDDLAHSNRELALLTEKLAAMRLIAEEAQKAKAAFAAKISHEFRTPLNMIIGLIDTLTETPEIYGYDLPLVLLNDLEIVHRNSHHLASLINDVLDLSQTEAGRLTLHRDWVDLRAVIENAVLVVRPLLEKKKLDLQVTIPDSLARVYCDETRIRQVILNLISNAARYTEKGGITVFVEPQGHEVTVSVTDTGPGISPEEAGRIFEPFYQSSTGMWRDQDGSGLGLSISQQFIELHGGEIWLDTELNRGSTFAFKLPVSPPTSPTAGPGRWINQDWVFRERTSWPNLPELPYQQRAIICDETGDLHPLFSHYSDEIEFVNTKNLSETLAAVQECPAHLVIVNATSRNNLGTFVERARQTITDTPIIGCSLPPRLDRAFEAGAVDYLIKPVVRADLERVIEAIDTSVRRVLVVDDNPDILQLFTRMLLICDESLEVTTASNGQAALEKLRNTPPDLMLLDIIMPGMDGWQVLEQKRKDEAIKSIPVAMVSAEDITDQPVHSKVLMAATNQGFSINKLLDCSFQLSALMMQPD
jgi:signal transduction histidine kinase/CheY-like chemotaxis protein